MTRLGPLGVREALIDEVWSGLLAIEAHLFDLEILQREDQIKSRSKLKAMEQEDRLAFVFQKLGDNGNSLTLLLRYERSLNRSCDKAFKQLLLLRSASPKASLGSFRIFEKAEPPAPPTTTGTSQILTNLADESPAPPAMSVRRL